MKLRNRTDIDSVTIFSLLVYIIKVTNNDQMQWENIQAVRKNTVKQNGAPTNFEIQEEIRWP